MYNTLKCSASTYPLKFQVSITLIRTCNAERNYSLAKLRFTSDVYTQMLLTFMSKLIASL